MYRIKPINEVHSENPVNSDNSGSDNYSAHKFFYITPQRPMTHSPKHTTLTEPRIEVPYPQPSVAALAFDYTEWQRKHYENFSVAELNKLAVEYASLRGSNG